MFVCCECCVLSGRGLRRIDHSSRGVLPTVARRCVWSRNLEKTRRLKPATGLWKIQPQWVVTPRKTKQTHKQTNKHPKITMGPIIRRTLISCRVQSTVQVRPKCYCVNRWRQQTTGERIIAFGSH
jgi:hypothetical protein